MTSIDQFVIMAIHMLVLTCSFFCPLCVGVQGSADHSMVYATDCVGEAGRRVADMDGDDGDYGRNQGEMKRVENDLGIMFIFLFL